MTRTRLLAATLLAGLAATPTSAATVAVWEGNSTKSVATNATYIDSATPNNSFGTQTTFKTGGTATGLLSFPSLFADLGLNPANITITGATLDLCVPSFTSTGTVTMKLATENWTDASTYTSTGANGISTGATVVTQAVTAGGHSKFNITSAVLAWQTDATALARGLSIRTTSGTYITFASDDHPNFLLSNNERPSLSITYTVNPTNPVPAPPAVLLLGVGGLLAAARSVRRRLPPPPAVVA